MKFVFGVFILIFITTMTPAEESLPEQNNLDLRICIQRTSEHYPLLQKQKSKIEEMRALESMAKSGYYPKLKGLSSLENGNNPVYAFGTLLRQNQFTESDFDLHNLNNPDPRTNFNFALEAELPIFNAFQTVTSVKIAKDYLNSAIDQEKFLKTKASYLAIETYLSIRMLDQAIEAVEEVLNNAQNDLKQAKDLKEKGLVLGADYYAARVIVDGIQQEKVQLDSQRKGLVQILLLLMGEENKTNLILNKTKNIPIEEKIDLNPWIEKSFDQRMDLKALQGQLEASEKELFREKATRWPRVAAFGRVEENTEAWSEWGDNFLVGVRAAMDLYDPSYPSRIGKIKHQLDQIKSEKTGLKDLIKRSIIDAHTDYETILNNRENIRNMLDNATEAVGQIERLYKEGKKSIADLMEMRKAHLEAKLNQQQYAIKTEMFYVKLLFVSGFLNDPAIEKIIEWN